MNTVIEDFGGNLTIPENFTQTVPAFDPNKSKAQNKCGPAQTETNPQTTLLCSMLDLTDPNAVFLGRDSSFKMADDADQDDTQNVESDDDVEDDVESEASLMSFSESEKSLSDRSCSFMSTGNESMLSAGLGNDSFMSGENVDDNVADKGLGEPWKESGEMKEKTDNNSSVLNELGDKSKGKEEIIKAGIGSSSSLVQKLATPRKRFSLSERLKNFKPLEVTSSPASKLDSSMASKDDDDAEFAEMMLAQKIEKTESSIESDSDAVGSKTSVSSVDSNVGELDDDDAELREMLQAQKSVQGNKEGGSQSFELATDSEDLEFQEIVASQKKNQTVAGDDLEFQRDFEIGGPAVQSSPIVNIDSKIAENESSYAQQQQKRQDTLKGDGKSPAAKKFKRRNQNMYVNQSEDQV